MSRQDRNRAGEYDPDLRRRASVQLERSALQAEHDCKWHDGHKCEVAKLLRDVARAVRMLE